MKGKLHFMVVTSAYLTIVHNITVSVGEIGMFLAQLAAVKSAETAPVTHNLNAVCCCCSFQNSVYSNV